MSLQALDVGLAPGALRLHEMHEVVTRELPRLFEGVSVRTSWLSGSLVEGLGNRGSDVDVFVVVESLTSVSATTRRDSDHYTYAFVSDEIRFDVEYWAIRDVLNLAQKLARVRLDDPEVNSNHYLMYWESEFIHRLLIGIPLIPGCAFDELQNSFNQRLFSHYLFEHSLRLFDDAFDDSVGMLSSGQVSCASLRARECVGFAIDALLYASGDTNNKTKFRTLRLERLANLYPQYKVYEKTLWMFECGPPLDERARRQFAEDALFFSSETVGMAQDRVHQSRWNHISPVRTNHELGLTNLLQEGVLRPT